jgi:hypothetical protein
MDKLFNRILVPFHRWKDADSTIRQAIELANRLQSEIHLLQFVQGTATAPDKEDPGKKDMRQHYQSLLKPPLVLTIARSPDPIEEGIIGYYRKFNIDLIFLYRKAPSFLRLSRPFFPLRLNHLLKKVKCPVLNMAPGAALPPIKNIVLPVGDHFPVRKLLFATYLAGLSRSTIHLVSAEGLPAGRPISAPGEGKESLQRSYRLLKENTDLPVECWALPGQSLADATWTYAKKIKADLILIQSGRESHLSGPFNVFNYRYLFNASGIPVLTVP